MSANDRHIPYSPEAEQSVIGGLMLDNDAIDRCGDLRAEHFFDGAHRMIFAAVTRMIADGKPADPVTVGDAIPDLDRRYLSDLMLNTPSARNIGRYAEIVRERAQRRGLLGLSSEMAEMAMQEGGEQAPAIIDAVQGRLEALADATVKSEPVHAGDDLRRYIEVLEARREGSSGAMPTGFPDLDRLLAGGIRRGTVIVIAARPKVGKTGLALGISRNVAADRSVLLLEMEMPTAELHDRNVAALGRVPLERLLNPNALDDDDWSRVTAAIGRIENLGLYVDDQAGLRLIDVRTKARMVKRRYGLDLLVIDYLQLMEADGDNRNAQIESITRGLKTLAKEMNIGVVLLSQLNRELEKRQDKRPQPSDLRDSGSIEQDCDAAIFLYRDELYHPDTEDVGIVEAHVGLNRHGPTGTVGLQYIGEQTRFESLEQGIAFGRRKSSPRYSGMRD